MILRVEVQKLRGFSWLESLAEIYENNEGTYAIYTFIYFRQYDRKNKYIHFDNAGTPLLHQQGYMTYIDTFKPSYG